MVCDFTKNGYRLATEAEWEKAARGGLSAQNFPWGNTISHSQANYYVYTENGSTNYFSYDISLTRGHHPTYDDAPLPYTSPVGSFGADGYGLYDMTGNVWEWCWDWCGSYPSGPLSDPAGPAFGSSRVSRGGSWNDYAFYSRVSVRYGYFPPVRYYSVGFRLARGRL